MSNSTEERRIVTVLFADVSGSTELGEVLDPEDVRRLLSRYYSVARQSVEQHGGTVEKFIGDAVMAVFGLPTAHGDDPDRAIAAAIAIRDRVRSDVQLSDRLTIRFGVSTGPSIGPSRHGTTQAGTRRVMAFEVSSLGWTSGGLAVMRGW
jgi:class 3 adenylate cyclase